MDVTFKGFKATPAPSCVRLWLRMLIVEFNVHWETEECNRLGCQLVPAEAVLLGTGSSGSDTESSFPVNCLDRHVHVAPDKVALIWEKDEPGEELRVTYRSVRTSEHM